MFNTIQLKRFKLCRRYGIEIETSGEIQKKQIEQQIKKNSDINAFVTKYQSTLDLRLWHIKDDATCGPLGRKGPKGVEIASFVGENIKDLNHIAKVISKLSQIGCKVNENCGLHVHAEAKDLSVNQVAVLLSYWIKIENILGMSVPDSRKDNFYCKCILDRCSVGTTIKKHLNKFWSPQQIWMLLKPKNLSFLDNDDRKVNLNIVNYARALDYQCEKKQTLELRWPEGSLDSSDIKNWVILFLSFIEQCKDKPMPNNLNSLNLEDSLNILGLHHSEKAFCVFDKNLHHARIWFLQRIIKNGNSKRIINKAEEFISLIENEK